jgi:1-acyl-sn-glycerol-3-phosphate acyltransferase
VTRPDFPYRIVRGLTRFWIWFFFKRVEIRHAERVPAHGPVLLAINHPNNLIDTILVGSAVARKVHYLATASLFRNRMLARFLFSMGVIPIYRRQDAPDRLERGHDAPLRVEEEELRLTPPERKMDNVEAFEACDRVFEAGGVIGIYPEGTTHAEPRVQRIKTGAARIALESEARHHGALHLALIPVGLSFELRKSFRSRVRVSFGDPIPLVDALARYHEDPWKAVEALTTVIQESMKAQIIHVDHLDLTQLIRDVEMMYRGDLVRELIESRKLARSEIDTFRLSRTIVQAVHYFQEHDPDRVQALMGRIQDYKERLKRLRLQDATVRDRATRLPVTQSLWLGGVGVIGLPIFAYGVLTSGLPYVLPRWLSHRIAKKETDYATTRLLVSVVVFPLFYGIEIFLVSTWLGRIAAALFALSLPASGLFAYYYVSGVNRLRQQVALLRRLLTQRQAVARLVAERHFILNALERAKVDFLEATRAL